MLKPMSPEQLRQFTQSHHEQAYLVVDVRQPEEYRRGHIPGALLLPLPELVKSMDRLPADKELIFYCHSGGRSMAAAAMVAEEERHPTIYNLTGGMLAWDGGRVSDVPRVNLFAGQSTVDMLHTAMNLEKGAQRFYEHVSRQFTGQSWAQTFAILARAEVAHAKVVHGFWSKLQADAPAFEALYDQLGGEVLEGGLPLNTALEKAAAVQDQACLRFMEMALQIEYAAFDLYRTLSDQFGTETERSAFLHLAQAEKAHMQGLIKALEGCKS
ncbi:MAG: sulfurtransferase [Desulfobacterales bacterium]|nr:sulfurtransferase [Desulfobacterales bacterium]